MDFNKTLEKMNEANMDDPKNTQVIKYDAIKDAQKIKIAQQKLRNNKKVTMNQIKDPSGKKVIGYTVNGHINDIKQLGL